MKLNSTKPNELSWIYKFVSIILLSIFTFKPLYEFVDIYYKNLSNIGWCCMIPCNGMFEGYFFI